LNHVTTGRPIATSYFKTFVSPSIRFQEIGYFPETGDEDLDFVRNPFIFPVEKLPDECQDEFLELIDDSSTRQQYEEKLHPQFWLEMKNCYPKTTEAAHCILIPFTYLC